jgi:hypothetical protein
VSHKFHALALSLLVATAPALASSFGITNFSGNPATQGGSDCNVCHSGGVIPTVVLSGPVNVQVGKTNTYSLTVTSNSPISQRFAGLDVSTTDGRLVATQAGTIAMVNSIGEVEITHSDPLANSFGGNAVFEFDWTAPLSAGSVTMYGAGNSVNNAQATNGDAAATATLAIAVGSVVSTPGETSGPALQQMLVTGHDSTTGEISLTYVTPCGATDHSIHYGELTDVAIHGWNGSVCGIGTGGSYASFDPGSGSFFFVVVAADDGGLEGSYGRSVPTSGPPEERPDYAANACGVVQDLENSCAQP